jgi:hypothetical protein
MRTQLTRLRATLVLLLVGSGLLFAIGSTIERHQHHNEQPAATAGNGESGESGVKAVPTAVPSTSRRATTRPESRSSASTPNRSRSPSSP